jgi:ribosomal-protein-alanine N-acetyltransferase
MNAQIRAAREGDVEAILALERASATAPHWSERTYREILEGLELEDWPRRCMFVADMGEGVAGFAVGMVPAVAAAVAELESVAVAASARRKGLGRRLCAAVFEWCGEQGAAEIELEVRASSVGAIALYAGLGFAEAGRRPGYYRDPDDDAVRMRCEVGRERQG